MKHQINIHKKLRSTAIATTVGALAAFSMISESAFAGKARGHLYSTAAVNRFCSEAQQVIATTDLKATVIIYEDLAGFVASDATPYRTMLDLPLTNPQHIVFGVDGNGDEYVQGVLCKMKSADGLNDAYPGLGAVKTDCNAVNQANYTAVVNSLTNDNQEPEVITDVEFDNWTAFTGQQWTNDAPAPFAYTSTVDGKLHLVGKELWVNVNNPIPFIGPEKKGVDYCQVPAPEYIRELITGAIAAPVCDAPPAHSPNPFDPIPTWNCQNP